MAELRPYPPDGVGIACARFRLSKARCRVKRVAMLHRGAMAVMCVAMLGIVTAGCDDMPDRVPLLNGADLRPGLSLEPAPIRFTPLGAFSCTGGGFAFDPSFHLIVSAGVRDVTLDSVTIHMVDGSSLGGPSVTIPRPELSTRFGSTLITAGTTRDFALRPDFGCVRRAPTALRGSALLLDQRGMPQTIVVQGRVQ